MINAERNNMASSGDNARVKGITIIKPVIFGNVSHYFGKKRESDGHTHGWTVFLRPFKNEDMSSYVKKVHFKLHESYANPLRVVTKPPYEVNESGWGEFEIQIKIFFMDQSERPVSLFSTCYLMLFCDELLKKTNFKLLCCFAGAEIEQRTTASIGAARQKIGKEISELNEKLKVCKDAIQQMKAEIAKLEQQEIEGPEQSTAPAVVQ
ncbi:YEATS domain-containing protein 4-like [Stylophora pistillata]|uniref:YEATS domain-containing protein 4-like n=1 Tax=Stylophora pistillata TaxID=50429 RepID=UPI000C04E4F6|nr:YEATS domain-containing protein 4-like [Stylophora pistillata]